MEKLEIYKNTELIKKRLQRVPEVCETIQKLFNKFNGNGLTTSFEDLMKIIEKYMFKGNITDFDGQKELEELLKNIAVDSSPETVKVMGFKMKREKLLDLIEIEPEDIQELLFLIASLSVEDWNILKHIEFDTKTQLVKTTAGHAVKIETDLSVFADNEKQIKVTKLLLKLKEAINEWVALRSSLSLNFDIPNIDGLLLNKISGKDFVLDVEKIKRL